MFSALLEAAAAHIERLLHMCEPQKLVLVILAQVPLHMQSPLRRNRSLAGRLAVSSCPTLDTVAGHLLRVLYLFSMALQIGWSGRGILRV